MPEVTTAWQYAQIKIALEQAGHPIPENDIWIAALARQHKLILASRDAHFAYVPDLNAQMW